MTVKALKTKICGMALLSALSLVCSGSGSTEEPLKVLMIGNSFSLSCMTFTVLSGAISHYREGEVLLKLGAATGAAGIAGALAGTRFAFLIPAKWLSPATAIMLLLTTVLLYLQLFRSHLIADYVARNKRTAAGSVFYIRSCAIGLFTGFLSGAFGIGATAFIQICLMLFFGISLYHAIGTTMMIIVPIAAAGGLSYLAGGMMDTGVFVQTLAGLTLGSFIGAKFTHLIPKHILRYLMISMPLIGGLLLLTH